MAQLLNKTVSKKLKFHRIVVFKWYYVLAKFISLEQIHSAWRKGITFEICLGFLETNLTLLAELDKKTQLMYGQSYRRSDLSFKFSLSTSLIVHQSLSLYILFRSQYTISTYCYWSRTSTMFLKESLQLNFVRTLTI